MYLPAYDRRVGHAAKLCTCDGEPVDELRSEEPAFARYVEFRLR
jgi:hypothetical protein